MTRALLALRGITRRLRDIPGAVIFMDPIRSRFLIQERTIVVPDFDGGLELEVSLGGHMGSPIAQSWELFPRQDLIVRAALNGQREPLAYLVLKRLQLCGGIRVGLRSLACPGMQAAWRNTGTQGQEKIVEVFADPLLITGTRGRQVERHKVHQPLEALAWGRHEFPCRRP